MRQRLTFLILIISGFPLAGQTIYSFETPGNNGKVVLCDNDSVPLVFDSIEKPYTPTTEDIHAAETLLNSGFISAKTNGFFDKRDWLSDYSQQCLACVNRSGHILIWINCMCNDISQEKLNVPVLVLDGGNCYFNVLIDLTYKKIIDFLDSINV